MAPKAKATAESDAAAAAAASAAARKRAAPGSAVTTPTGSRQAAASLAGTPVRLDAALHNEVDMVVEDVAGAAPASSVGADGAEAMQIERDRLLAAEMFDAELLAPIEQGVGAAGGEGGEGGGGEGGKGGGCPGGKGAKGKGPAAGAKGKGKGGMNNGAAEAAAATAGKGGKGEKGKGLAAGAKGKGKVGGKGAGPGGGKGKGGKGRERWAWREQAPAQYVFRARRAPHLVGGVMQTRYFLEICGDRDENVQLASAVDDIYSRCRRSRWMADHYEVTYPEGCTMTAANVAFFGTKMLEYMPRTALQLTVNDFDLTMLTDPEQRPPAPRATVFISTDLANERGEPHGEVVVLWPESNMETYLFSEYWPNQHCMEARARRPPLLPLRARARPRVPAPACPPERTRRDDYRLLCA